MSTTTSAKKRFPRWVILLLVGGLTCMGLFVYTIFTTVNSMMRNSPPYQTAMEWLQTDSLAVAQCGTPITQTGIITGNISTSNNSGEANLRFDVQGPKGSTTVHLEAVKQDTTWEITSLYVLDAAAP